jgi:hypothetical protein
VRRYEVNLRLRGGMGFPGYNITKTVTAEDSEAAVEATRRLIMPDFRDRPFQVREARVESVEIAS